METPERWEYDAQFVHGTLSRISQIRPAPKNHGVADFEFGTDDADTPSDHSAGRSSTATYAGELINEDGERRCPAVGCDWWVPSGMEYLYAAHRLQHVDVLSGELDARPTTEGYSGPVDIEVWGTLTDTSDPGTVTIDICDSPDDEHASFELRIEQASARELGVRLIEAAGHARDIQANIERERNEASSDDYAHDGRSGQ
jgi:hypothetical protein